MYDEDFCDSRKSSPLVQRCQALPYGSRGRCRICRGIKALQFAINRVRPLRRRETCAVCRTEIRPIPRVAKCGPHARSPARVRILHPLRRAALRPRPEPGLTTGLWAAPIRVPHWSSRVPEHVTSPLTGSNRNDRLWRSSTTDTFQFLEARAPRRPYPVRFVLTSACSRPIRPRMAMPARLSRPTYARSDSWTSRN